MERAVIVVKMYFQTLKTDDIVFNGKRHNLSDVILSNHFKHQSHSSDTDNMIQWDKTFPIKEETISLLLVSIQKVFSLEAHTTAA